MPKYSSSGPKSEKGGWGKPSNGPRRGPSGGSARGSSPRARPSQKAVKKFDPSMFMKKVEEQSVSPAYIPKNMFSDFLIEEQIKKNISDKKIARIATGSRHFSGIKWANEREATSCSRCMAPMWVCFGF